MTAILERHRERFRANADDTRAFEALQEHLFLAGEWEQLIALYERRLTAATIRAAPRAHADVELRLGQIWQERIGQVQHAIDCYTRAIRIDPSFRPALRQMRGIHAEREQWDVVLQIAELEAGIEMPPNERAQLLCDIGLIWLDRLDDAEQALVHLQRSLAENATLPAALEGAARASEAAGLSRQAAEAWRRLSEQLRGPERARSLIRYAQLLEGPLERADAAIDIYRAALSADPMHPEAVEAISSHAIAHEQWPLLADLEERRFELARMAGDVPRQAAIALEAGRLNLERLRDPMTAEPWLGRARELAPENPCVYEALADLERERGNDLDLLAHLERRVALAGAAPPISALLEAASLRSDRREHDRALLHLERALELAPEDALVVEALSDTLATLGRHGALVDILERRAALAVSDPESRAATLAELGAIHRDHLGDDEAALDAFERAFDTDPAAPGLAATLELYYRKSDDIESLRSLFERAAADGPRPERTRFLCSLGELLAERFDEADEALRSFERALMLDARCTTAHRGMQRCAEQAGDDAALERAYALEARVTDDLERTIFLVRELARLTGERGETDQMLGWTRRWAEVAPHDPDALAKCAELEEQMGLDDALLETLTRLDALLSGPALAAHRRRVAALHLARGSRDEAIDAYRRAVAADAGDRAALEALVAELEATDRSSELADARRQLAALLQGPERAACLDALALLLEERLGDTAAAIDILLELCREPAATRPDTDLDARLENALERTGRFEELASRLSERAAEADPGSAAACDLELRRGHLLLDHLDRFAEAADAFESARASDAIREAATAGLETALRAAGQPARLAAFLAVHIAELSESELRDRYALERATLLEESLDDDDGAREILEGLSRSARSRELRTEVSQRLQSLLERSGQWSALREHLEGVLAHDEPPADGAADLHESIAELCRDRLRDAVGAVAHFEAAASLAPDRDRLWRALAGLHDRSGRSDDLVRALEGELETRPDAERELCLRARAAEVCAGALADPERARVHAERVLALDPTHAAATEMLIEYWERAGQPGAVVCLLEDRLHSLEATHRADGDDAPERQSQQTVLRLRIASVRSGQLGDVEGATSVLERALEAVGPMSSVAEPLADLYERAESGEKLASLCQSAAEASTDPAERASWYLRLGNELCRRESDREARQAFHHVLSDRPDDCEAQAALRGVYRRLGEAGPLARLLQVQLSTATGEEEIAARMELAALCAQQLERPEDALLELRRVLQIEPGRSDALEQAIDLAERLNQQNVVLELVDGALQRPADAHTRAVLHMRRGQILAQLSRLADASLAYRAALAFAPEHFDRGEVRRLLHRALEEQGRYGEALDTLYEEAGEATPDARAELFARAADVAANHISTEASLPWLQRLLAERPDDAEIVTRIAEVHRRAGRSEALLHALEKEASLVPPGEERWRALMLERAELLESEWNAHGRAARVLEQVRDATGKADPALLQSLVRLYRTSDRTRELAEAVGELADCSDPTSCAALHREAAELHDGPLRQPRRAAHHWFSALAATPSADPGRGDLLRALSNSLRAAGSPDAWARCAEAELLELDETQPVFRERRRQLHADLAHAYATKLSRPDDALRHQRQLVRSLSESDEHGDAGALDSAEQCLLGMLREQQSWIELEARLTSRLERRDAAPAAGAIDSARGGASWLELARLRDERLRAPRMAADAYRRALCADPTCLPALRGLRANAERLGDWSGVASALEAELEHAESRSPARRAALLGRLGDIYWRRLHSTTRASASYAAALEADPRDHASLHSLQNLLESVEDWRGAQDLFESEAEALGDADPERRREVWLRVGDIGRDHTGDLERALVAYTRAAEIRPLSADRKLEIAKLHQRCGHLDAHAEVLGQWCDDPEANASAADHTELATVLEGLDRPDAALERARRALELEPVFAPALDLQANLLERRGDRAAAAAALSRAAECVDDAGAAQRLLHAAELVEGAHRQAAGFLRNAVDRDPGNGFAHAHLARVEFELGAHEQAERAAGCALDLLEAQTGGSDPIAQRRIATLQCEVALIGGRCASLRGRAESAASFYARGHAAAPDDAEALARYGESLGAIGDFASARVPLQKLLDSNAELGREERARYLVSVGRGHEHSGDCEEAERRFEAALQDDPSLDEAHEGLVALHRRAGRIDAGIACLERWAGTAEDPADFGARMLQAAVWEIEAGERGEAAERHLRSALDALPESVRAWQLLASLLWEAGRVRDALEVSTRALAALEAGGRAGDGAEQARAALALVRARAHEAEGQRREAAESFALAASAAPDCSEAVLGRARLLRALGEWREAADALSEFVERHRGDDPSGLAQVLQHLGRLLAGPLEDVDGAVDVYRRAAELDPDNRESREMLADLLSVRPGAWDEARAHHALLLEADPANARLLQAVLRAAQSRGADAAVASGARILHALGVSSPCAEAATPGVDAPRFAGNRRLSDRLWEKIRCVAQAASREISTALDSSGSASLGDRAGEGADFRTAALAAEADLVAPALLPLTDAKLAQVLTLLAALALDPERARGEGQLVNALSSALGRRTRRRIQKILAGESLETIERIDFPAWRDECRALARAIALDTSGGSLRAALVELACADTRRSSGEPDDAGDISSLVSASPGATALLRRVVRSWLSSL